MTFKYKVEKIKYESNFDYQSRVLFIKNMKPTNSKSFDHACLISIIMNNILNLHCIYPNKLQNEVQKAIKNFL